MTLSYGFLSTILAGLCLVLLSILGYLLYLISVRDEQIIALRQFQEKMTRSFRELDDQAKLIVRTDLELNRAQSELDKRLGGLNALQRVARSISQALNENEIYQRLTPSLIEELSFAKALIVTLDQDKKPKLRLNLNFLDSQKVFRSIDTLLSEESIITAFKESHLFSSANTQRKIKDKILAAFETEHFILAPITTQNGLIGFVFVGNRLNLHPITQGDEELISILAGQIGQAIENAQLFEKVFKSSQELEINVRERTKQLALALEKVEEISKKKSDFISAVSHELRTPLTSIKGFAALLIAGKIGDVPESVKERLIKINNHSDNLVSLINNLLDTARIESGRVEMKFLSHSTKQLIDNVVDLLSVQINAKEIKITTQVPPQVPTLWVDASQAERVFINLLSNAIKFTPKGGAITIAVSPLVSHGFATCHVTDTGIGIPAQEMSKLFSEFYRVDNEINQHVKGTGLGLVLAKNIVHAHKGKIWVTSQPGAGTTFAFTLPTDPKALQQSQEGTTLHA